jgi:hypothetical protein
MRLLLAYLIVAIASAQDDPWAKVKTLASGGEVRIVRKGASQSVIGQFDEANDERLVVVLKNEQVAIPKAEILRLDYRPPVKGSKMVKSSQVVTNGRPEDPRPRPGPSGVPGPSSSASTSYSSASKGEFETVYRFLSPAKK